MVSVETVIFFLTVGYAIGFYVRDRRAKEVLAQHAAIQLQKDARRQQYHQENDLSDPQNQFRFINESSLKAVSPVNKEASRVLYAIDEWIKNLKPDWRFAFEVGMGSFIRTYYAPDDPRLKRVFRSYSGKRVDFLLIDRYGKPVLVVEYNGSGHNLSGDADARMAVKRLTLQKANIPLLEIAENMGKSDILAALSEKVGMIEEEKKTAKKL